VPNCRIIVHLCVSDCNSETFKDPVLVWDAVAEAEALILAYIVLISADNPMHAEDCSSTGLQSKIPCRICGYGGPQSARKSEAGFAQVVEVSAQTYPRLQA
jgi:hypothetical protein